MKDKKAVAFAGLADNAQFFDSLEQAGCRLDHTFSFADHHRYGCCDLDRIAAMVKEKGSDVLVTTLKDFVKIKNEKKWPVSLTVVDVTIQLSTDEAMFRATLTDALALYPS